MKQCFGDRNWGDENRSISDDFGDETDTTFVPCILLFSPFGAKAKPESSRLSQKHEFSSPQTETPQRA
jgi:hypothetical protein